MSVMVMATESVWRATRTHHQTVHSVCPPWDAVRHLFTLHRALTFKINVLYLRIQCRLMEACVFLNKGYPYRGHPHYQYFS